MPETMLPLYLWDLRAQVESQLRMLTDVQRLLDLIATTPPAARTPHTAKIVSHLTEILNANAAIRDVTATALEAARTLNDAAHA